MVDVVTDIIASIFNTVEVIIPLHDEFALTPSFFGPLFININAFKYNNLFAFIDCCDGK